MDERINATLSDRSMKSTALNGHSKSFYKSQLTTSKSSDLNHDTLSRSKKKLSSRKLAKSQSLDLYNNLDISDHVTPDDRSTGRAGSSSPSGVSTNTPPSSCSADASFTSNDISRSFALEYISDYEVGSTLKKKYKNKTASKKFDGTSSRRGYPLSYSTSLDDTTASTSSSSTHSPTLSRVNTLPTHSTLSRSYSVASHCNFDTTPRRKRLTLFGRKNSELMSASLSSIQSSPPVSSDIKIPSPARFTSVYHAVRRGVSEHISVNTAELNVLQVRKKEAGLLNAAQTYDSDKLIKHLERVIKKLQYQQTKLDEIHEAYTLQQRYREGAYKLKSALSSSRVSSRASMVGIKSDLCRCTETLCTLEQEFTTLLGRFHIEMKGLMGFARLRSGDQYEVVIRYGTQKWRMRGTVKSSTDQTWDNTQRTMQPLLTDLINIKVMEIKLLGKHSTVGNVSCETKDLFKVESQDLLADLNDTATLKLSLKITWCPYDGYEAPPNTSSGATIFTSTSRLRTRSVMERPVPSYAPSARNRLSSAFSRPLSVIYSSSANANNSNNRGAIEISAPITGSYVREYESAGSTDENSNKKQTNRSEEDKPSVPEQCENKQGEEDAFIAAISKNVELAANAGENGGREKIEENPAIKKNSSIEISISSQLMQVATDVNLQIDDYRGRYDELARLEDIMQTLLEKLKVGDRPFVMTDGFKVVDCYDVFDNTDDADRRVLFNYEEGPIPTTGNLLCDEAMIPHLKLVKFLLKDVGVFGPLKVRQILAFDKLQKQGDIIRRIYDIATSAHEIVLADMEEFKRRRALLEMWRSCCDGNTSFCVSAKTLRLELVSAFGREVRKRHADVADKVFPELVKRIVGRPDLSDIESESVTLFHLSSYVNDAADGESEDFEKLVDKLALEMFITSTLQSGMHHLVLVAIKRISSLLALRISNLRALSHLLLDGDHVIRTAAAAHIRHISTEKLLRDKAISAYAELLESSSKRDRQCACIAIGFLSAVKCTPQLAYLYHSDVESDVREAASNVLLSLGEDGQAARDHASSTLLAQTMTQQVTLSNHARMGTAL